LAPDQEAIDERATNKAGGAGNKCLLQAARLVNGCVSQKRRAV
jgi:hypothetical protein